MSSEVNGFANLEATITRLRVELPKAELRKAVRAGANVLRDAMGEAAPVLDRKTAESTSLEPGALKAGHRVYMPADSEPIEALVGPGKKVEHVAGWVTDGHRIVKDGYSKITGTGTRGPGRQLKDEEGAAAETRPNPYLVEAYESSVTKAQEAIAESMAKSFEEIAR